MSVRTSTCAATYAHWPMRPLSLRAIPITRARRPRCREVRRRFPDKPWLDVFSKADMLGALFDAADSAAAAAAAAAASPPAHAQPPPGPSAATASEAAGGDEAEGVVAPPPQPPLKPVELAMRLPHALRISSVTHEGIPQLQLNIIQVLRANAAAAAAAAAPPATATAGRGTGVREA